MLLMSIIEHVVGPFKATRINFQRIFTNNSKGFTLYDDIHNLMPSLNFKDHNLEFRPQGKNIYFSEVET